MSFSSGTFSLVAGNPVVTGTTISSTVQNNTMSDVATGLSTCVLKDGTQATTASVPFVFGIAVTTAMTTPSTTFALVNTTATTLNFAGAATTLNIGAATSATTWTGQSFSLTGANSTNNTSLTITNSSNAAAASHSYLDIAVGGTTSTGDPHTRWTIPGGTSWYGGVDNSDSDSWKLGTGSAVGTTPMVIVTTGGAMTITDDLAVNGDTLSSDDATFTLLAGPTTVNAFQGASTALNMGHASGTTSLAGILGIKGATRISTEALYVSNTSGEGASFKSPTNGYPSTLMHNADTVGNNLFIDFGTEGTYTSRGNIDYNRAGGAVRYNTTSDQRLKDDLGIATDIRVLTDLKIHNFKWKETGSQSIGVFAQEAYKVYPDAISIGSNDGKRPWGASYATYVPHLIVGWQNHEARLRALEQR